MNGGAEGDSPIDIRSTSPANNLQGRKPDDQYGAPTEAGEKIQWIFAR